MLASYNMNLLKLSYSTSPVLINQGFGVNGAYYRANGINIIGHNGIDFFAYHGMPVYAPMDGTAYYEEDADSGHGVVIVSDKPYDYKNGQAFFKCILWHFCDPEKEPKYASPVYLALGKKINSGVGTPVKKGDLVGHADSTGLSSGDHLHFGLKPITSGKVTDVGDATDVGIGEWENLEGSNGYLGAIDPTPYFDGTYVVNTTTPLVFTRDLHIGLSGEDVRSLQKYLNSKGFLVAKTGAGSPGNETASFGPLTQEALIAFQKANKISPTAGYFGPITRKFITGN